MPEGHTLHRLALDLTDAFAGQELAVSSPQGRFAEAAALLDGSRFDRAEAWGKHLALFFDGDRVVHVHLGLIGRFTFSVVSTDGADAPARPAGAGRSSSAEGASVETTRYGSRSSAPPPKAAPKEETVRLRLVGERVTADLRAPTVCALLSADELHHRISMLGPDPLRDDADPERAWTKLHRSGKPVGELLLDQAVLAGVGNVYRAEVLFRLGLDPLTPGRALSHDDWQAIWDDLVALMRVGVERNRIDTVRPEHEPEAMGRPPRKDDHGGEVYVYRRDGQSCLVCGSPIAKADLAGRNLFWCPDCQR